MAWEDIYDLLDDMKGHLPQIMDRIAEDSEIIDQLASQSSRIHTDFNTRLGDVKDQMDDIYTDLDHLLAEAKTQFSDIE